MRAGFRYTFIPTSLAMFGMCYLPVLSTRIEDAKFVIRVFNLPEFSPWGAIPVFAVLLLLGIALSSQHQAEKEKEVLLLSLANVIAYVHSITNARAWLDSFEGAFVLTHPWLFIFPVGYFALLALLIGYEGYFRDHESRCIESKLRTR